MAFDEPADDDTQYGSRGEAGTRVMSDRVSRIFEKRFELGSEMLRIWKRRRLSV